MFGALADVEDRGDLPVGHFLRRRHFACFPFHCLAYRQGHARAGLGNVFAQHQYRIVGFDIAQAWRVDPALAQHFQHHLQARLFAFGDAGIEVVGAHQFAQREVAFNAGARGADADHFLRLAQDIRRPLHRLLGVKGDQIVAAALHRLTRTVFQVHVAIAETTAVAEEVAVNGPVITVFDTTQFAIAFARTDVTADGTLLADARRKLHVPLTVIALRVGFVGEDAGWADFHQVAGELALQGAIFRAAEVDVVVRAIDAQIGAVGIIFVVAHAAVAGDAAVHFVRNKRPQILIAVGTLGKTIAAEAMAGHHRHILQVAVAALFADRAVVRVVSHQPLHHAFAELLRFAVVDRNKGAVGCRSHTGHHQATTRVFRVLILLHRTLAASTDAP